MPILLAFTSTKTGDVYTASYWRVIPLCVNEGTKTGNFQFHGWKNLEAFEEGLGNISDTPQSFTITTPEDYDTYLGQTIRLQTLETYVKGISGGFFEAGDIYSYIRVSSIDIGVFNSSRLYVQFTNEVGGPFTNGVTIKINGSPVGIVDADVDSPAMVIRYDIDTPANPDDVITWEYDSATGMLEDDVTGAPLLSVAPITVINEIGSYLHFNNSENSALAGGVA